MQVLFDFDGTLLEGGSYPFAWLVDLARTFGYQGSHEAARSATLGQRDFDLAAALGINRRPRAFTQAVLAKNLAMVERAQPDPAVVDLLVHLAESHQLYVLSNRDQASLDRGVELLGWQRFFTGWVGTTAKRRGKPSADLLHHLEGLSSSAPTVYVGDRPGDEDFARRLDLPFIAACWYRDYLAGTPAACLSLCDLPARLIEDRRS